MNHKNFKTVWCKKFLAGYCPYGPRCCFIHHISEKRLRAPSRPNYLPPGRNLTPNWMGIYGNEFGAYVPNGVYTPNGAFATRPPRCMDMSRFAYCPGRHPMVFNRPHTWWKYELICSDLYCFIWTIFVCTHKFQLVLVLKSKFADQSKKISW